MFHLTLTASLHYLVKYKLSIFGKYINSIGDLNHLFGAVVCWCVKLR